MKNNTGTRKYAVLRSMRGLNSKKVQNFSKESSMKKNKLKIGKVGKKTKSFIGKKESPSTAIIGRMTKNFIRDEYLYKGKKAPKGDLGRNNLTNSKHIARRKRKRYCLNFFLEKPKSTDYLMRRGQQSRFNRMKQMRNKKIDSTTPKKKISKKNYHKKKRELGKSADKALTNLYMNKANKSGDDFIKKLRKELHRNSALASKDMSQRKGKKIRKRSDIKRSAKSAETSHQNIRADKSQIISQKLKSDAFARPLSKSKVILFLKISLRSTRN